MEVEELEQQTVCAACGRPVWEGAEPGYAFSETVTLCFGCGVARGGSYDALDERWATPPDVSDLIASLA